MRCRKVGSSCEKMYLKWLRLAELDSLIPVQHHLRLVIIRRYSLSNNRHLSSMLFRYDYKISPRASIFTRGRLGSKLCNALCNGFYPKILLQFLVLELRQLLQSIEKKFYQGISHPRNPLDIHFQPVKNRNPKSIRLMS